MSNKDGDNAYDILEKQNEILSRELERQKQISTDNSAINGKQTTLLSRYYRFLMCAVPILLLLPYLEQLNLVKLILSSGEEICQISIEQAEALLLGRNFVTTSLLYRPYQVIADFAYIATAIALIGFFGYNYLQNQSERKFDVLKIRHVSSAVDRIKIIIFTLVLMLITVFIVHDAKKQVAYYEDMVKVMDDVVIARYAADGVKNFPSSDPKLRGSCFTSSNIEIIPTTTPNKPAKPLKPSTQANSKPSKNTTSLNLSTQ